MAYTTLAEVRALPDLSDTNLFPDAWLQEGIDFAEETIDDYCGTSFTYKAFTTQREGIRSSSIIVPVLYIQDVTAVDIDGEAVDVANVSAFENEVRRTDGYFAGHVVTITGTAGVTDTPPTGIAWAARTIARQYALDLVSRIPDRSLQVQSDFGQIQLAQAGGRHGPTNLPDVNAVLKRNRHK